MSDLDNDSVQNVEIGIVGSGSMGGGMTMLFAEHGSVVGCFDKDPEPVKKILKTAKETDSVDNAKVHGFSSLEKLVHAFPKDNSKPRIFVLSLPHGKPVDGIADELLPLLSKGDIVIDGGNEWWEATERRQKQAEEVGVEWVGMGVSGGYQAARRGPSMSPGCNNPKTYETIKPLLEKWAAKTKDGEPCVEYIGPGGAGNYVKMLHNGIEHAHLSILCETRGLLYHQLGMSNAEIADLFESWFKDGGLRGNFLVGIGYKGLRFTHGDGIDDEGGIVDHIEDKVTQDVDLSEGTGTWSTMEIATRHVAAPAIAASHQLRVISADKGERLKVVENLKMPEPSKSDKKVDPEFLKVVEKAVYGCILGAFVQGLDIITRASEDQKWNVSLATCMRIWRAGCIIQSDAISEFLLPLFEPFGPSKPLNILQAVPEVAQALRETYEPIKQLYRVALDTDAVAPAIAATLEWLKSVGGARLPTDFEEMELDYFGHHNYDIVGQTEFGHKKGKHHTEFAPA